MKEKCFRCAKSRRACPDDCPLKGVFPKDEESRYETVTRVFSPANVALLLRKRETREKKMIAADSMLWEAECWQEVEGGPLSKYKLLEEEILNPDHKLIKKFARDTAVMAEKAKLLALEYESLALAAATAAAACPGAVEEEAAEEHAMAAGPVAEDPAALEAEEEHSMAAGPAAEDPALEAQLSNKLKKI